MVEVPDSTTRYIQNDSGKPTKDLFNWMKNTSSQLASIFSGTGGGLFQPGCRASARTRAARIKAAFRIWLLRRLRLRMKPTILVGTSVLQQVCGHRQREKCS